MVSTAAIVVLVAVCLWQRHQANQDQHYAAEILRQADAQHQLVLRQEERNQALLHSMAAGVLVVDENCRIVVANPVIDSVFGFRGETRGRSIMETVRAHAVQEIARQTLDHGDVRDAEIELPSLSGASICLSINSARLVDHEGQVVGATLVMHDITRLRQMERSRIDFVANVSHELRTPLTIIKGYAETLLDTQTMEEAQRFGAIIGRHADRLTTLVEDLLTITGLESGRIHVQPTELALDHMVDEVFAELASHASKREVELKNSIKTNMRVFADPARLHQVLINLIENAIKYGDKGGRVEVDAAPSEHGYLVRVLDEGPGIPIDARERVFERFHRLDKDRSRETGGTGLGLAIVKHIVLAHGGRVWAEDAPSTRGAAFCFELPRDRHQG
jgi:two-component system, OmpR family, phosphate regulon sensor histidine kinase PhoR